MGSAQPVSVRFDGDVQRRLRDWVERHPGWSLSGAANRLVDESLRMQAHPRIVFRDGPSGRRAGVVGGPDVWEIIRSVQVYRDAEPALRADALVAALAEGAGVEAPLVDVAIRYWTDFPEEVQSLVDAAARAEEAALTEWTRRRQLLGA